MENKKSKVTAIAVNVRQWKDLFYHTITFENGDSGDYGSKSATCEKFKQGEEAEYTLEVKVNGNYTNKIIKPIQAQSSVGGFKSEPRNQKAIIAQSSWASAVQWSQKQDFLDIDTIKKVADFIFNDVCEKGGLNGNA